jgi:hypothetical protein
MDAAAFSMAGRPGRFVTNDPAAHFAKEIRQRSLSSLLFGLAFDGAASDYHDSVHYSFCITPTETYTFNAAINRQGWEWNIKFRNTGYSNILKPNKYLCPALTYLETKDPK